MLEVKPGEKAIKNKDLWEKSGYFHPFLRMPKFIHSGPEGHLDEPLPHREERHQVVGDFRGGARGRLIATDKWTVQAAAEYQRAAAHRHVHIEYRRGLFAGADQRRVLFPRERVQERTFSRDRAARASRR